MNQNELGWPACHLCGRVFRIITSSHLKTHNHTFVTYKEAFPGVSLVDDSHKARLMARNEARVGTKLSKETKDAMSKARTGKKHSQETKDKIGAKHAGKKRTKEEIEKWRESFQASLAANGGGFATGPRSDEFKAKMKEIAKARPREVQLEKAKKMQDARRGSKATPEQRENYRNGTIKWMADNPDRVFNTGVELAFKKFLTDRGVWFIQQYVISGIQHPYDFYLPDYQTIVEIDGPQHWKMAIWGTSGKSQEEKDKMLDAAMVRDAELNLKAGETGHHIVRIQVESSIENSPKGHFLEQMRIQGLNIR